jgi:hypothetical protein
MSWDRIEGQWKQRRGKAMHHWGKMMNDELAEFAGKHEELVERAPALLSTFAVVLVAIWLVGIINSYAIGA